MANRTPCTNRKVLKKAETKYLSLQSKRNTGAMDPLTFFSEIAS